MFEYDKEAKKIIFTHNPFSMPQGGLEALNTKDPRDILAYQYDIVCNGVELSSGAETITLILWLRLSKSLATQKKT